MCLGEESKIMAPSRSAVAGTIFNLLNTILGGGGGIVPLPRCVKLAGPRFAPMLLAFCAVASACSAFAIVEASCVVREHTYQGVARRTIGRRGAMIVQILVVSLTFGISIAVMDIFADVAPSVLHISRTATVICAGCTVMPIVALVRRIEQLAIVSVAATVLVAVFVAYVWTGRADAVEPPVSSVRGDSQGDFQATTAELMEAVSVVNLSFLCHFNLLPLFRALSDGVPSRAARPAMHVAIAVATTLALLVYGTVGVLGFQRFGERTSGNAFADYASAGPFGHILNSALATAQLLSLPLLVHEGVRELVSLLGIDGATSATAESRPLVHTDAGTASIGRAQSDDDLARSLISATRGQAGRAERHCAVLWCAAATVGALFAADTSKVLALVAALCGAPLMSVLPMLMLLRSPHSMGRQSVLLLVGLLLLGIAVCAASAANALGALLA